MQTPALPYRITLSRAAKPPSRSPAARPRRGLAARLVVVSGLVGLSLNLAPLAATPAGAAVSCGGINQPPCPPPSVAGGSTATLNVAPAVRSVNVSPSSTTFDMCHGSAGASLTFPDDVCVTTGANNVTITNGALAGHIDVSGADAVPKDSGTHWTLCGGSGGPGCSGTAFGGGGASPTPLPAANAGPNQFWEYAGQSDIGPFGPILTNSLQADTGFSADSSATASQSATEALVLQGPTESSDLSSSFTTVWTWTAVP